MKVNFFVGKSYRKPLENNRHLDVHVYPKKFYTIIKMNLYITTNPYSLSSIERRYINWNMFLPLKIAEKLAKYEINKKSRKVAGINFV